MHDDARNARFARILLAVGIRIEPDEIADADRLEETEIYGQVRIRISIRRCDARRLIICRFARHRQPHGRRGNARARRIRLIRAVIAVCRDFVHSIVAVHASRRSMLVERTTFLKFAFRNMHNVILNPRCRCVSIRRKPGKEIAPVDGRGRCNWLILARRLVAAVKFHDHAVNAGFACIWVKSAIIRIRKTRAAIIAPEEIAEAHQGVIFDFAGNRETVRVQGVAACAWRGRPFIAQEAETAV